MTIAKTLTIVSLVSYFAIASAAAPVVPTDAGRVLQDNKPAPLAPSAPPPPLQAPQNEKQVAPAGAGQDIRVNVTGFTFSGNTVISSEKLQEAVAPWVGKALNFAQLLEVTDKIEAVYHDAGYFLAQATLPPQQIHDGTITIVITEGKLGQVRIEGESRISPETVYRYLDRLPKGEVVTERLLDRQTLLINDLAGSSSSLDLQAGAVPGTTDVVLAQKVDPLFTGSITIDNYGMPATGEDRLSVNAALNSPFHLGDRLSANFALSDSNNLHTYGLNYDLPLGGNGWRVNVGKTRAVYSLGAAFKALTASGTADAWHAGVSYPWLRSRTANINLQLQGDYSDLRDNLGASGLDLKKTSRSLTFSPNADWQDKLLGGGSNQIALDVRYGSLDLGSQAKTLDIAPAGPDADGSFGKFDLNLQRRQTITNSIALSGQWKHQFATTNLDSSEKISVGGAQNLVAYPSSQATGDEGGFGKLELRWQARNNLSVATFVEYAHLKLLHNPLATATTNHGNYRDVGFGVNWSPLAHVDFAASIAWAGNQPPNPSDNDRPRLWANLGYSW